MAQLINYLPWISLIAGLTGSLHCVSMCGGLVAATTRNYRDVLTYQLGRLLAYSIVALASSGLIHLMHLEMKNPKLSLIPGIILGLLFIYWGTETFLGKRAEIPMPKKLTKIYSRLFSTFVLSNQNFTLKAFFTGTLSIFLPCGILYSIILTIAGFDHPSFAFLSIFFFWIGTLPAMILAPTVLREFLNPLKSKVPKIYASILIIIGVGTISYRVAHFNQIMNHQSSIKPTSEINCH